MLNKFSSMWQGNTLGARVLRGSTFTFLGYGGQRVLRFASNVILARLLFPEAFGLMVLVQVVISALEMFSDTGVNSSIVQSKRGTAPVFLQTAFSVQIGRGILLWFVACLVAGPFAAFYDEPRLQQILPVAAFSTVIMGFSSINLAVANKKLILGRITLLDLGSQFLSLLITVLLAWWLQSVWALVIGSLLGRALKVALSHIVVPGDPSRIGWNQEAFKELFHFGKFIFLGSVASFFINSGDKAILGKFVTLTDLAVYNIGWLLASVPAALGRLFERKILFPLYASIPPADSAENRLKIAKVRFALTAFMLSISCVLGLVGEWIVQALYLPEYHLAGPILTLVAIATLPSIIVSGYAGLLLGAGNSRNFTILLTTRAVLQTTLLYFGVSHYGLSGAMVAMGLAQIMVYPLTVYMVRRYRGWNPVHDAIYFIAAAGIAALILTVHPEAVSQVMSGSN